MNFRSSTFLFETNRRCLISLYIQTVNAIENHNCKRYHLNVDVAIFQILLLI